MNNMFQNIIFGTRSNDGVTQEHPSLTGALEAFIAEDGYRIDFIFPDGRVLYIHRAEYGEDIPEEKINHPAWKQYFQAIAKIMLYDPNKTTEDLDLNNIVYLNSN